MSSLARACRLQPPAGRVISAGSSAATAPPASDRRNTSPLTLRIPRATPWQMVVTVPRPTVSSGRAFRNTSLRQVRRRSTSITRATASRLRKCVCSPVSPRLTTPILPSSVEMTSATWILSLTSLAPVRLLRTPRPIAALVLEAHGGPGSVTPSQMMDVLHRSAFQHDLDPNFASGKARHFGRRRGQVHGQHRSRA